MNEAQTEFLRFLLTFGSTLGLVALMLGVGVMFVTSLVSLCDGKFTKGVCLMFSSISCIYVMLGWLS